MNHRSKGGTETPDSPKVRHFDPLWGNYLSLGKKKAQTIQYIYPAQTSTVGKLENLRKWG